MTDPLVRLEQTDLVVQPGGQVRTKVTVSNPGQIVEGFRFDVLGDAAAWAEVTPPEVQVYPQQEASAVLVVSPPAGSSAPSGRFAYGVRARSVVDGSRSAVDEGDLDIGAVFGLQSKLTPVTSSGRWSAGHAVELTNWGNATERLHVAVADPDERLAFLVHPQGVEIPVGATAVSSVLVRSRRPFLRGSPRRLPFQVVAAPAGVEAGPPPPPGTDPRRASLDGAFEQRPLLSRWSVIAATAVVLLVGALVAWALTRPSPAAAELVTTTDVAPPTELTATPDDGSAPAVQLAWEPRTRSVEAFSIYVIDPATRSQNPPRTVEGPVQVDGERVDHTIEEDLDEGTEYCFQMVAQRGDGKSERSNTACATTGGPETPSPTGSPTGTDPTPTAPPGDPDPTPTAPPTGTTTPTGTNGTDTSTAPPGDGAFRPEEWVAVVYVTPVAGGSTDRAQELVDDLVEQQFDAGLVDSSEYPGFGFEVDQYVVYVRDDLVDEADVRRFCDENPQVLADNNVGDACLARQPAPRGSS